MSERQNNLREEMEEIRDEIREEIEEKNQSWQEIRNLIVEANRLSHNDSNDETRRSMQERIDDAYAIHSQRFAHCDTSREIMQLMKDLEITTAELVWQLHNAEDHDIANNRHSNDSYGSR